MPKKIMCALSCERKQSIASLSRERRRRSFAKGEFLHHLDFALQLQSIPLLTIALTRWLALMAERNIGKPVRVSLRVTKRGMAGGRAAI